MGKRANGEGSIYERKDERWATSVTLENGKRKTVYGKTQKEVHPNVVQEMLGHSSISVTLDTYSHVIPTMQAEAVERLGDLLTNPT